MKALIMWIFASLLSMATYAKAPPFCDATEMNPCLVQDTQDAQTAIKHFRDTTMLADAYQGNISGLTDLKISGSGALHAFGWDKLLPIIKAHHEITAVLVVDLRQETHGYLNHHSINLTTIHNWINLNKNLQEINTSEQQWLQSMASRATVDNILTLAQFESKDYVHGITLPVTTVTTEQTLVESLGYIYLRLPITDHRYPLDLEVDRFVAIVRNLPKTTWLHFHCRGGKGRTTTFMAMYDMLKNADKVSFDDIIKRQAAVDPFYDLSKIERSDPELTIYYKERYAFLENFYKYAYAVLRGYHGTWSEWKA